VADVCALYQAAPALAAQGERVVSTDELTGVQALERKHPGLPLAAGKVERREFEYERHGTTTFILNRDVVGGQALAPSPGPTRTEADFVRHVRRTVATDPEATRWLCRLLHASAPMESRRWSRGATIVVMKPTQDRQGDDASRAHLFAAHRR
jgi:hypothetical protein